MKQAAYKRIIIWSVVSGILLISLIAGVIIAPHNVWGTMFSRGFSINGLTDLSGFTEGDAELNADEVNSIKIDWTAGSIQIVESPQADTVRFTSDGNPNYPMGWKLSGGELKICSSVNRFVLFNFGGEKNLTLEIPKNKTFEKVDIDSASADVIVDSINADMLKIDNASGEVIIGELSCENADISTVSGDCEVNNLNTHEIAADTTSGALTVNGSFDKGELESVSGKISFTVSENCTYVKAETVSGSVGIDIADDCSGFTLKHDTVSGSMNCELNGTFDGKSFVYKDGSTKIAVETVSGNVNLNNGVA